MEEHIRQSNLIENIDDEREDRQSMIAWCWLLEQPELNNGVIMKLQKIIVLHQPELLPNQKGYYRGMVGNNINVRVGHRVCPEFSKVKDLMKDWLKDYRKNAPITNHIRFERIHPFVDGNGRTGRMLMWWQELHEGKLPTLYNASERFDKYYPLFGDE